MPRRHHLPGERALGINTRAVRVGLRVGLEVLKYTTFSSLLGLEPRVLGCSPRSLMAIVTVTRALGRHTELQDVQRCLYVLYSVV
jgi:hypothetical protein